MKQVNEIPTSGQFVVTWEFEGKIWSDTYRWADTHLLERYISLPDDDDLYDGGDMWSVSALPADGHVWSDKERDVVFFVM